MAEQEVAAQKIYTVKLNQEKQRKTCAMFEINENWILENVVAV